MLKTLQTAGSAMHRSSVGARTGWFVRSIHRWDELRTGLAQRARHWWYAGMTALLAVGACERSSTPPAGRVAPRPHAGPSDRDGVASDSAESPEELAIYHRLRERMVAYQLRSRDITDERVLEAMASVPRHQFVPPEMRAYSYDDRPLPIEQGQTISQPYIVALMTQLAAPGLASKVLDVGTGSGYQAAILAELAREVYSIEILSPLALKASQRLADLGYENVEVRCGDGYLGWPEKAPFDAIIVAAAPDHVPQPLVDQLAPGGRLVLPVGDAAYQHLVVIEKHPDGTISKRTFTPVLFVPMTGKALREGD